MSFNGSLQLNENLYFVCFKQKILILEKNDKYKII